MKQCQHFKRTNSNSLTPNEIRMIQKYIQNYGRTNLYGYKITTYGNAKKLKERGVNFKQYKINQLNQLKKILKKQGYNLNHCETIAQLKANNRYKQYKLASTLRNCSVGQISRTRNSQPCGVVSTPQVRTGCSRGLFPFPLPKKSKKNKLSQHYLR